MANWIVPWALENVDLGKRTVEIGPGPGPTTNVLMMRATTLTAVEIHPDLAASLTERLADRRQVTVLSADGAHTGLPAGSTGSVVCLTMLHHVPTAEHQDAIFGEARRLLAPGGIFAGSDNRTQPSSGSSTAVMSARRCRRTACRRAS